MTDEMYAKLRKPGTTARRDHPLGWSLVLAAAIALAVILPLCYMVWYGFHWHAHTAAVSESTKHAYYFGGVQGTVEGEAVTLTVEHTYDLYETLTERMSKLHQQEPADTPAICLVYGDGATLEIWEVALEETDAVKNGYGGTQKQYGVFWRFTSYKGQVWMYDTDQLSYRDLWLLCSPAQNAG